MRPTAFSTTTKLRKIKSVSKILNANFSNFVLAAYGHSKGANNNSQGSLVFNRSMKFRTLHSLFQDKTSPGKVRGAPVAAGGGYNGSS